MSHRLSERGVDHVVLERGRIANTWRTERWDSLRLLTPNWQTRLPGLAYDGDDPNGFMSVSEVVGFLDRYQETVAAPVLTDTPVERVSSDGGGFRVQTGDSEWRADAVVLATGGFNTASVPAVSTLLPPAIEQITTAQYRRPGQVNEGRVLVVGASATGVQLAAELQLSGRDVTLAVGEHVRLPRTYRERDIMWWLDRIGRLDERFDQVDDIVRARHVPSPQLVGSPQRDTLDLNRLQDLGVRLVGRLGGVDGSKALFSGGLGNTVRLADLKMARLLREVDEWAELHGLDVGEPDAPPPTRVDDDPVTVIDLAHEGFGTVVWATGFRPDYTWLDLPVVDRKGQLRHVGGVVTEAPGLYRLGLNFLRRRKSSFIHGADDDTRDLADHLLIHLDASRSLAV